MALGIDIFSDGMTCSGSGEHTQSRWENYGIIGLTPRRNEPFIWNNPRALRRSTQGPYISMTQAWSEFMSDKDGEAKCEWLTSNGYSDKLPAENLIAEAIRQNIPQSGLTKTVISIDNNLNEFQQDALIKGLRFNGFTRAELLWRPVAIALYHLNSVGRDQCKEGDILFIVDLDSYLPELTVLRLKLYRDELVPVRDLPPKSSPLDDVYSSFKLKREFISKITDNPEIEDQLINGPFAREYFSFIEGKSHDEILICNGLSYSKFPLDSNWRKEIADYSVGDTNFINLRNQILELEDYQSSDHKIWNGFPCRIQDPGIFTESEIVVDNMAVAQGAADYAQRQLDGRPTYLDTLPGIEILSEVGGTGHHKLFTVIPEGVAEGGKTVRIPEPLTHFMLEKETEIFTSVLRNIAEDSYKKLETAIPPFDYEYNVPVVIRAEMRPANGHALVTIEGNEKHRDVFGRQRRIQLDWKNMDDFEFDDYSGPEFYPVQGRIADDPECRTIARTIVNDRLGMGSTVNYRGHRVRYVRIHEPWGYYTPWKARLEEPTRALFGAKEEHDDEIDQLADGVAARINETVTSVKDRHKYLNYMFCYAPESFLEELRDKYTAENPDLNWNTVYGVGRTFYKADDYELFLDFLLKKSVNTGYPAYPDESFTKAYFWSFFRALCYYEDTIQVPVDKVEKVLRCLSRYVDHKAHIGWRDRNEIKFLLCSILFSLRFRKIDRTFLELESKLWLVMKDAVRNKIPKIDYPKAMFATRQPDKLNDYVYRFLAKEATEQDFGALKGLTTSMS